MVQCEAFAKWVLMRALVIFYCDGRFLCSGLALAGIMKLTSYKHGFFACLFILFCFSFIIKESIHPEACRRQKLVREALTPASYNRREKVQPNLSKKPGACFAFHWKGLPEFIKVTFPLRTKPLVVLRRLKGSCSDWFFQRPKFKAAQPKQMGQALRRNLLESTVRG